MLNLFKFFRRIPVVIIGAMLGQKYGNIPAARLAAFLSAFSFSLPNPTEKPCPFEPCSAVFAGFGLGLLFANLHHDAN